MNYPPTLQADLVGDDLDKSAAAFGRLIVEHDVAGFDGEELPPGGSPDLYRVLPAELTGVIYRAIRREIGHLPGGDVSRRGRG